MNKRIINNEFLYNSERQSMDHWLADRLTMALQNVASSKAVPTLNVNQFQSELKAYQFEAPKDLQHTLDWVIKNLENGLVHMTHPGYFGLFNPAPTYAAECADRIAAAFNPQICVWSHAPVAVDIERHVIAQIAQRIGFSSTAGGHFTSGGTEANHTAVTCALTMAHADFERIGSRAFKGQPRLYASKESHLAWLKIAHQSGIGREAVCLVATDGMGRMDATALREAVEDDVANGCVPVFIAATAGTTNAGMIDPLIECAKIAAHQKLWFHVDAAWGGALIADPQLSKALVGIEQADSVTIDAHKWFATTMGAGMYITSRPEVLTQTYRVAASYMPSHDATWDYYLTSMQWSRRFIGLRLFLALACHGWQAQAARMRHGLSLIEKLKKEAVALGWNVVNDSCMAVVCLTAPESLLVEDVVESIVADGESWVSVAQFEQQVVMRVCITNGQTELINIENLIAKLKQLSR